MDAYQQYIHKSRYARYLPEEKRRETWEETVARYVNYFANKFDIEVFSGDFGIYGIIQVSGNVTFVTERYIVHKSTVRVRGDVGLYRIRFIMEFGI